MLDEAHVPYKSQVLKLLEEKNESIDVDLNQDKKMFSTLTPQWNIVF
jgi:hypothetical protein